MTWLYYYLTLLLLLLNSTITWLFFDLTLLLLLLNSTITWLFFDLTLLLLDPTSTYNYLTLLLLDSSYLTLLLLDSSINIKLYHYMTLLWLDSTITWPCFYLLLLDSISSYIGRFSTKLSYRLVIKIFSSGSKVADKDTRDHLYAKSNKTLSFISFNVNKNQCSKWGATCNRAGQH